MAVRIGFIGSGGIANHHMRNLATNSAAEMVAFSDPDVERARAAAKQYGDHWTVEMRVPFGVLGMDGAPEVGRSLDMQFGRQRKPVSETTSWTPGRAFIAREGYGLVVFE